MTKHLFFPSNVYQCKLNFDLEETTNDILTRKKDFDYKVDAGGYQGFLPLNYFDLFALPTVSVIEKNLNKKIQIFEIWGGISYTGDYNRVHNHPVRNPMYTASKCYVGVLYLNLTNQNSNLNIHSPFNLTDIERISIETGDLIFFRNNIYHSVPPETGTNVRVYLAFNFNIL